MKKQTVLVTGSNGLLGQKLIKILRQRNRYIIYGVSRGENRLKDKSGFTYADLDLTDDIKLTEFLDKVKPEVIFHTAAMTNVDQCELDHEGCDGVNIDVVKTLTSYCKANEVHLIHISTDFIFNGEKGFYKEDDEPDPVNYYGLSKLRSEQMITAAGIDHTILRTILVFGLTDDLKSNIVFWVKNNVENEQHINVVTDQLRMPTFVDDLAEACVFAAEKQVMGTFNVSGNTLMNIYDVAVAVAEEFRLDKSFIHPIPTSMLKQPAKRPLKTGFDLKKSITHLNLPSVSFTERLQVFKNQLKKVN